MKVLVIVIGLFLSSIVTAAPDYRHLPDSILSDVEMRYGFDARERVQAWRELLRQSTSTASAEDLSLIKEANDYFNQVKWVWDIDHWGQEDYWATPVETLATNGGDCEDFSIGKYFSLVSMGVQTTKLRITYVKALRQDLAHMVLAYYSTPSSEPLILDNINKTVLPASKRRDLLPVYSFNGEGLWLAKSRALAVKGDISKNLPSWGSLKERMERELK